MKRSTSHSFTHLALLVVLMMFVIPSFAQVGINTLTPAEMLDVNGNLKLDGAFMPNNAAGTAGQLLESAGVGNPPTWGANLTNVTDITRYTVTGPNLAPNTVYSFTVGIAGVATQSTAIITLEGLWPSDIFDDLTFHNIEMRVNEIRFSVSNNTPALGGTTYLTPDFNITIIR